jgi:hypothetical protein
MRFSSTRCKDFTRASLDSKKNKKRDLRCKRMLFFSPKTLSKKYLGATMISLTEVSTVRPQLKLSKT